MAVKLLPALAGSTAQDVFSVGPVLTVLHFVSVQLLLALGGPAVQDAVATSLAVTVLHVVVV